MVCTFDDGSRHACQFGYVDTKTMLRTASYEFAQEDDLSVHFADGDVVVADTIEGLLHLVEFVVVGSKEGLGVPFVLVDIFDDCPSDGDTIVRAGTSSEFVEEHKASFGEVVEDRCRFVHLDHESGLAEGDVIGRSDAGEDLIYDADGRTLGRHERTHLCEKHDEGCLAE